MEAMESGQNPSDLPYEGVTLDCIAKMGCAVPLAPTPSGYTTMSPSPAISDLAAAPVKPMIGRNTGPEPHPLPALAEPPRRLADLVLAVRHHSVRSRIFDMKTIMIFAVALAALDAASVAGGNVDIFATLRF